MLAGVLWELKSMYLKVSKTKKHWDRGIKPWLWKVKDGVSEPRIPFAKEKKFTASLRFYKYCNLLFIPFSSWIAAWRHSVKEVAHFYPTAIRRLKNHNLPYRKRKLSLKQFCFNTYKQSTFVVAVLFSELLGWGVSDMMFQPLCPLSVTLFNKGRRRFCYIRFNTKMQTFGLTITQLFCPLQQKCTVLACKLPILFPSQHSILQAHRSRGTENTKHPVCCIHWLAFLHKFASPSYLFMSKADNMVLQPREREGKGKGRGKLLLFPPFSSQLGGVSSL